MKKITIIYGTRPEFIKLIPLIKAFKQEKNIQLQVITTNQHTDLLKQAHEEELFTPDISLAIQRKSGDLNELVNLITEKLYALSKIDKKPDLVIVHGDTASAFASALFAFQFQIPIAHIEAGLRSHNLLSPFPEEFYRQSISKMATFNFVPSKHEYLNLKSEGVSDDKIYIVGNTIVDAVKSKCIGIREVSPRVLISIHRRESRTQLEKYLNNLNLLANKYKKFSFEFIVHPSNDKEIVQQFKKLNFLSSMGHSEFLSRLNSSEIFVTDSGGGQEEASILGVRTLVVRDKSERSDGFEDNIKLIGNSPENLSIELDRALQDRVSGKRMAKKIYISPSQLIKNTLVQSQKIYTRII